MYLKDVRNDICVVCVYVRIYVHKFVGVYMCAGCVLWEYTHCDVSSLDGASPHMAHGGVSCKRFWGELHGVGVGDTHERDRRKERGVAERVA
jgi:hypothetical protein